MHAMGTFDVAEIELGAFKHVSRIMLLEFKIGKLILFR